ncbi:MAG: EAL domain-containing protein [Myxococcota bacterium]
MSEPPGRPEYVVALGASAGGLEALRPLVARLRPNGKNAYIVAQHIAPHHDSVLTELLARETELTVETAVQGHRLAPDHVYVVPPDRDVLVRRGRIVLQPASELGPKPSIDALLSTLAAELKERAVCVILSGTGTDGTHGSRAIKEAGGLVIAQHPHSARHDGMPGSVIRAGLADLQLDVSDIADRLSVLPELGYPRLHGGLAGAGGVHEPALKTLLDLVYRETHIDFGQYKETTLLRQIERRMRALGLDTLPAYLEHAQANAPEVVQLQQSFLISVTSFFRDPHVFDGLRAALGELVGAADSRASSLRIWAPGSATGEEAYSIAILLAELLGPRRLDLDIKIFATDIDPSASDMARAGVYPAAALQGLGATLRERYFVPDGESFRVDKSIRDLCIFSRHDLTRDPPFLRMDLIACRNVLIYFKPTLQEDVLAKLHYALSPGGLLVLGRSESPGGARHLFSTVDPKLKIYRRKTKPTPRPMRRPSRREALAPTAVQRSERPIGPSTAELVRSALLDAYAPPSVLIGAGFEPLHFHGAVGRFLQIPAGAADFGILALCSPALRAELHPLLLRLTHGGAREVKSRTTLLAFDHEPSAVQVTARVVGRHGPGDEPMILVSFEERAAADSSPVLAADPEGAFDPARLPALQQELAATREHLGAVIAQLETTNDDFRTLAEEMQASTEELQASNEELQTTNEELHAANEELTTLNDELQARSAELVVLNDTLSNIQASIPVGMVLVDRQLRVLRFSPLAVRVFGLIASDIGQGLLGVPCHVPGLDLRGHVTRVIDSAQTASEHVRAGDTHYLMQISPYLVQSGECQGALLTFADVSELRRVEQALFEQEHRFRTIYDTVGAAIWQEDWSHVVSALAELRQAGVSDVAGYLRARPAEAQALLDSVRLADVNRAGVALFEARSKAELAHARESVFAAPMPLTTFIDAVAGCAREGRYGAELAVTTLGGDVRPVLLSMVLPETGAALALVSALDVSALRRAELALEESEGRLDVFLASTPNAVLVVDAKGRVARANRKAEELFGHGAGELGGVEIEELVPAGLREGHRAARSGYQSAPAARAMGIGRILRGLARGGREFDAEVGLAPMYIGRERYVVANVVDVTERLAAERDLRAREEKYRLVIDTTSDGFIMADTKGNILEVNEAYRGRSGYAQHELLRMNVADLMRPDDGGLVAERIERVMARGNAVFESTHRTKTGDLWPVEITASWSPHAGGRLFSFVRDISARRRAEEEIKNLAYYDVLTGLPNRRLLLDRIRQAMAASHRTGHYCALLFIDLDNFKVLNDTLGHEVGDRLLTEVARRLQASLRKADTVARLGGDEFVVMLEGLHNLRDRAAIQAEVVGSKILRSLGRMYDLGDSQRRSTSSIGISLFSRHDISVDELLKQTDLAMYQAKSAGRNALRFFDAQMQANVESRARLEAELMTALHERQLVLYYQTQVDADGHVVGVEALVRWQHPTRGIVMPADFVPLAEGTSLIVPLGAEVFRQACETLARWAGSSVTAELTMAVNVSARQFRAPDFVREVQTALHRTGALPQRLKIELTETILLEDVGDTRHKMMALREMGVTFSLDDFGTGYSSLAYLKRLPLDQIKIDKSFVSDMLSNSNDAVIACAVIALGKSLGLKVMAEGVETPEQWSFLLANGCEEGQGYLFARPVALAELEQRLGFPLGPTA